MKNIIVSIAIMISTLSAVDLRIAKGSYDTDISIKSFMQHVCHPLFVKLAIS